MLGLGVMSPRTQWRMLTRLPILQFFFFSFFLHSGMFQRSWENTSLRGLCSRLRRCCWVFPKVVRIAVQCSAVCSTVPCFEGRKWGVFIPRGLIITRRNLHFQVGANLGVIERYFSSFSSFGCTSVPGTVGHSYQAPKASSGKISQTNNFSIFFFLFSQFMWWCHVEKNNSVSWY